MLDALRGRIAPSVVSLMVLLTAAPALADNLPAPFGKSTLPTKDEAAEAKRRFDAGLKLFKAKNFEQALTEFSESYRLGRKATALRNLAQCHRELRQFPEAYEAFEWLMSEHGKSLSSRDRRDVQKAIKDLDTVTATIRLKILPDGTDVAIDGKSVGASPFSRPVRVTLGRHTVTAQKQAYDPFTKDVNLAGGQDALVEGTLALEAKAGHVVVKERSGADVRVVIDEKDVGPAPWEGDLEEGDHTVEVRGPKGAAPIQTLHVKRKERQEIVVDAAATIARLKVVVPQPRNADIFVDDRPVGKSSWEAEVSPGEHAVRITAPGYKPSETTLSLSAGENRTHEVILNPVDPPPPDESKDYYGMYARLELNAQFQLNEQALYAPCNGAAGRTCSTSQPPGGAAIFRMGYAFDFIGFEGVGTFLGQYSGESVTVTGSAPTLGQTVTLASDVTRKELFDTAGLHLFVGAGLRALSRGKTVRFTAGVTPGFSYRTYVLARRVTDGLDGADGSSASAPSFALLSDAGITIGNTPGFKLILGAQLMVDFASDISIAAKTAFPATPGVLIEQPSFVASRGTQIYLGPTFGFQFGN